MNPASKGKHTPLTINESLASLIRYSSRKTVAGKLGVVPKTLTRWIAGETEPPPFLEARLRELLHPNPTRPAVLNPKFKFIDLFAGIGGFRLGFEKLGGECVFTSEWDRHSQATYWANFAPAHEIAGDITKVNEKEIPDHDLLLAGFPCQPFSLAGVSKKNALGRPHGFLDETQGTLFFDVARIIAAKRPKAFVLENVKNLVGHNGGQTFEVICRTLQDKLDYKIHFKVIDAGHWVPQHRQRIFIVGFDGKTAFSWNDLNLPTSRPKLGSIFHPEDGSEEPEAPYTTEKGAVDSRYVLTSHLWKYLRDYADRHAAAGHGFGFGLVGPDDVARTLSARYYKDGSEILVSRGRGNPRRLTPRECARLMGFDAPKRGEFRIPVSDTQAYRQFGNAVVVPVVEAVGEIIVPCLMDLIEGIQSRRQLHMAI
jgi:DNA (cytosine-5)-methyltransferase 1